MQSSKLFNTSRLSKLWALALFAVVGTAAASAHEVKLKSLAIEHPWIRATAKGANVTAGYMTIKNVGTKPDRFIAASLKGAAAAELHETTIEDGIAKMRALSDGITIAPGETVKLAPSGKHVMFTGLTKTFEADEYVDGSVTFENAGKIDVDFFVEGSGGANGPSHDEKRGHAPPEHDGHH